MSDKTFDDWDQMTIEERMDYLRGVCGSLSESFRASIAREPKWIVEALINESKMRRKSHE